MPGMPPSGQLPMPAAPQVLHDVVVKRSKKQANVKVEPVPPEEVGISRNARSLKDAAYFFHKVLRTQSALIAQGYDSAQVKAIPTYTNITSTEEVRRDTVNEYQYTGDEMNDAARRVEITEHYVLMDYEGNDKACLYKVTTGGHQSLTILKLNGKLDIEEIDAIPFAAITPVIQTHRFYGRSIADLIMDIQRIKTAVLRGILDNTYLANNPRVEVAETHAGPDTLDDLLVSRPGGIVRTKQPGGLNWQTVPTVAAQAFPVMEYMDQEREFRTGVTRQGQGVDANALQNQSATAVNQVFSAAQAKVRLIARIFAETGIRDMFQLIHATIRKHGAKNEIAQLKGQWVTINPREWKTRYHMTSHVGLGNGTKTEELGHVTTIGGLQKELLLGGKTNIVKDKNLYNTAKRAARLLGAPNTDDYFTDPSDPNNPPPQAQPDPKVQLEQLKQQNQQQIAQMKAAADQQATQMKAALDQQKAQADVQHQVVKTHAEQQLAQAKAEMEAKLALLEHGLKQRETELTLRFEREKHILAMHQKDQEMRHKEEAHRQALELARHKAAQTPKKGD